MFCGLQAGEFRRETIERLRKDPMTRALRVDKLTVAALEATLELYQSPQEAKAQIPILAALSESDRRKLADLLRKLQLGLPP